MILSSDARRLWNAARQMKAHALSRAALDVRASGAWRKAALPPLLLFTDSERLSRPWEVASCLPAGAGLVYRAFGAPESFEVASRLRAITRERGVVLLIGQDADLADGVGADGVHLPERALSAAYALGGRRPDWLITGAAHSLEAAATARDLDAVVLSPIFQAGGASATKPPLGLQRLVEACRLSAAPVYALGGIDADAGESLIDSGACGMAGIGAFARAFSPNPVRI
ncbi:thiamine phosphate synthase [Brevundimonas variabilis]|uniref:Thiamine-phosphate pyrophosphorylase n=1 Tax=Brevundimonas variabilis TaxID=74312 RepID=A0A7W9CGW4_9CAUL|nr:thiamine phosphate synthase [Brevundimonas variabilis]MBB5745281.1 thiamine-phosphate pyrophosphorylase [Brevundimonas variabilis]